MGFLRVLQLAEEWRKIRYWGDHIIFVAYERVKPEPETRIEVKLGPSAVTAAKLFDHIDYCHATAKDVVETLAAGAEKETPAYEKLVTKDYETREGTIDTAIFRIKIYITDGRVPLIRSCLGEEECSEWSIPPHFLYVPRRAMLEFLPQLVGEEPAAVIRRDVPEHRRDEVLETTLYYVAKGYRIGIWRDEPELAPFCRSVGFFLRNGVTHFVRRCDSRKTLVIDAF